MGQGPPLVITTGALQGRASVRVLAAALADRATVHVWDRRGRGDSGGTPDPAVDPLGPGGDALVAAEVADLAAVTAAATDRAGGTPGHYAHSAGAALALEAVMRGVPAARVVAHEPPWRLPGPPADPRDALAAVTLAALRDGRPGDAAATFLGGFPAAAPAPVERLRTTPFWAGTVALAPSLPHDVALVVRDVLPADRLAHLAVPLLALDGGASPAWVRDAVAALAAAVPGARHRTLPGQEHFVVPSVLAPVLAEFLLG
ncbi:alpha/beta hydrolase [Actinomycetospora chlora]|uniref:Alpha/beta hydrolase n=1 Tax=Actinomycetospora chlora TaxID=663608 RepID=A0ABP9AC25_9PSEU